MCNACGNFYCGACNKGGISAAFKNCAMCRAPFRVSNEEQFNRVRKLIFGRSPGRHTHVAQCNLGAMYASGRGVKVDHVESEKCYRLSAEGGFAGAQFTLSSMYAEGQGSVKQDRAEAIKWLLRAANNGHTKAQVNLGGMHFTGTGVARNLREAVMWVQLALGSRARRRRRYLQPSRAPGSQPDPNAADRHCRHHNLAVFCQSCKVQQPKW